ncbi:hypothetical protein [Arthrobacter sp. JCM 19049]|uniref:hypothetical protein n=1 Tax=Arthrobacter sp. JCM 19049 TaxID=1460643 RepID=UPI0006D06F1D|nr:hypothetical protein [Arthrobacter sp. JCM 19049]
MSETNEQIEPDEVIESTDTTELTEALEQIEESAPEPRSESLFLAAARAMDDETIKWRIQSAVLFHAQGLLSQGGNNSNYAIHAVMNPHQLDPTMMALVLVDEAIAKQVKVSENGDRVDTTGVPDETILTRVKQAWPLVAFKYPNNPLQAG